MDDEPFAIRCRGLTKRYGSVVAVDGLDLEVPQRSLFGFLGPNGAGKTTVMRLLLGLARPSDGSAEVFGHDIVHDSMDIRRRVGYLPQQPRFHPELTARELLRYARGFFPSDGTPNREDEIAEVLDLVGLTTKADSRAGELSGGQRQRLGIAQAQIHRPGLLILDEPASALDPVGRRDVLAVMRQLKASATVFYSTHILDDVQQVSDEVAILQSGRRVLQSPLNELLTKDGDHVYQLALAGDIDAAVDSLRAQPWVAEIVGPGADHAAGHLLVRVSEDSIARHRLLRLVLQNKQVEVLHFGRKRSRLEDVFLEVVEGRPR